jgi:SOS-response transcriptional repressor LexA
MVRIAPSASPPSVRVAPGATVPDIIRAALEASGGPVPAKTVIQLARGIRDMSPEDVHRALYRLKESGEIEVTGVRPNRLYALKEAQTAIALAK